MKQTILLLLAVALAAFTGCSSTPTKVNETIHARSFSFVSSSSPTPNFADNRAPVHQMIHESIAKNLGSRGVQMTPTGGDVTVAYLVIIGDNASTELVDNYFGYGRDSGALHDKAHDAYTNNKSPNYFRAGTLLIDIIDSKTYKLLKRGYVTRGILQNPTAEARAANIQEAVDAILADVHIDK